MKRGKDDEKVMGPMFPRLHVNDTEKGGPRAPPRNKMALYEQLSIPSQRFNPGGLPLNPNNSSNLAPPGSSNQWSDPERNKLFHRHVSPSTPNHQAEKFHLHQSNGGNLKNSLARPEQRKKVGDEDDFRVPVFMPSGMGQRRNKTQNGVSREKLTPFGPAYSSHSKKIQKIGDNDLKHTSSMGPSSRHDVRNLSDGIQEACFSSRDHSAVSSTNFPAREKIARCEEEGNASINQQCPGQPVENFGRLHENDTCLEQKPPTEIWPNDHGHGNDVSEPMRQVEEGNIARPRSDSRSREDHNSPNEPEIGSEFCGDKACGPLQLRNGPLQLRNGDKSDDISETSMVDSVSVMGICPDDVVGIIGQRHFWKARRAIVNQQRVFAVQVFELHRLIKVQQLIAGSPHLLLEDSTYLGKPSKKVSPAKKLPLEYVTSPAIHVTKRKDDSEKPSHKMECSAENAVGKTSVSSAKNGTQSSNYGPYTGNPVRVPGTVDNKIGPWCYPQSFGDQWLVPVMSPSEGLVYKPYSAPGLMGSMCGGCGPYGLAPMGGNFMNPAYGLPASHHHGIGAVPGAPPVVHGYFPPYGMPIMNPAILGSAVDQMNYFPGSGLDGQSGQLSGGGANFNRQHQSSCNVSTQRKGAIPQAMKFQASKDTELQGSTASSPGERAQGVGSVQAPEGGGALPLFPTAPAAPGTPQPQETDQPTRVIRVVPHNARSATESAARIFQSIQEERKQHDSV